MPAEDKFHAQVIRVLQDSRGFGTLDASVLRDLADVMVLQEVRGGSRVLQEGDAADSLFFVITGRLRASRRNLDGSVLRYNEICPGESVGEMGLILRQPRAADVTAVRDSTLAVLHRADFEAILLRHPLALNRVFSQAIFDHLRHASRVVPRHQAHTFVVVPLADGTGAAEVAGGLVAAFARMGRVHHITPSAAVEQGLQDAADAVDQGRFDALEEQFDFLVYEADATASSWTLRAFRQADQVILVAPSGSSAVQGALEQRLTDMPGFGMKRQHLVLVYPAATAFPKLTSVWRAGRQIERVYPTRRGHAGDIARLARFLTGRAVGLVLGGGGARGFAHLGVLRALHEANIPVDSVGGNSMGALIGAQFACGVALDQIRDQTRAFAEGGEWPTLPLVSLVSGGRVRRDLRAMFGDIQADGLWMPYFASACNLTQGGTTVQETGPLWRAVLASNSPAGLFPPVLVDGNLLVDAAILENVPVNAMRRRLGVPLEKRRGNGTIVAIDVDVQAEMGVDPALERLSVRSTFKGMVSRKPRATPGIAEILYRAGHIGGLHHRAAAIAQADYYLEPPVAGYALRAYGRADEIIEVGYRHAMEAIEQWTL